MSLRSRKLFYVLVSIAVIVALFFVAEVLYNNGHLLPHYFTWNEKEIVLKYDDKIFDNSAKNEFSLADISSNITKMTLKNKCFKVYSDSEVIFETEIGYKVQDFIFDDIDGNNNDDILLLLWKKGRYGKFLPFWINKNDESWDQHIFIFDIKNDKVKPKWCSSYIESDVKNMFFDDRGILTLFSKNGCRTRYKWLSWGLQNISASKYDYDENVDKVIGEVKISAVGDNLINESIINYGEKHGSNYNFLYENVKGLFSDKDINVIANETMFTDDNNKYNGFPNFATPLNVGNAIVNTNFNMALLANNHSLDTANGIDITSNFYKENGIDILGIKEKGKDEYIIKKINGIKVGFINFTEFINNMSANDIIMSNVSNLINEKAAKRSLDDMVRKSDVSIVFVHWGNEYDENITAKQKFFSKMFLDSGIDLVIGTHPHILQKNDFIIDDNGHEMLVYYSLGNFVSNQSNIKTIISGILNVDIVSTNNGIKFKNIDLLPIITHKEDDFATIYDLTDYTEELAKKHSQRIDIKRIKEEYANYAKKLCTINGIKKILYDNENSNNKLTKNSLKAKNNLYEKIANATSVKDVLKGYSKNYTEIVYGKYKNKDLKWRLLDIKNNIAYLECINVVDKKEFDDSIPNSFRDSKLHYFLNTEFLYNAFNKAEAEYVQTFGVSLDCTYRFLNLGFSINDKDFLRCEDGDYWLLNLCDEGENTSNILMGKYVDAEGNVVNGYFKEIHGVKPVLKVPID